MGSSSPTAPNKAHGEKGTDQSEGIQDAWDRSTGVERPRKDMVYRERCSRVGITLLLMIRVHRSMR